MRDGNRPMLRADTEYTVWFDGRANGRNRGYLCTVADEPRPAPKRGEVIEDWGAKPPVKMTLLERAAEALTGRTMTAAELRATLGVSQSACAVALEALSQTGKLHSVSVSGHPRARGKSYWIVP